MPYPDDPWDSSCSCLKVRVDGAPALANSTAEVPGLTLLSLFSGPQTTLWPSSSQGDVAAITTKVLR